VIWIKLSNTTLAILLGKDGTQMERAAILLASYNPSQLVGTLGLDGELVGKGIGLDSVFQRLPGVKLVANLNHCLKELKRRWRERKGEKILRTQRRACDEGNIFFF
jgi:hypothetical protein